MDIKFENDLKNNIMRMTVSVQKRNLVSEEKIRLKWMHVEPFLQDYECPSTHSLGRCLNPIQTVDNDVEDQCTVTWTFFLEQKVRKISKKGASNKKPASKTTRKAKKTSEK